jgi:hypothetical protein
MAKIPGLEIARGFTVERCLVRISSDAVHRHWLWPGEKSDKRAASAPASVLL